VKGISIVIITTLCAFNLQGAERKTVWQGNLHLGDTPDQYSNIPSAGLAMQIPCKLDFGKQAKLAITTRDVQTLAGDGHFAELVAHYEDGDAPAREYVVETFRLKGNSTNADIEHAFELDPSKDLQGTPPAYYSVKLKVDTTVRFGLWDDFVLKRVDIEQ
jgi:hypothetical protein